MCEDWEGVGWRGQVPALCYVTGMSMSFHPDKYWVRFSIDFVFKNIFVHFPRPAMQRAYFLGLCSVAVFAYDGGNKPASEVRVEEPARATHVDMGPATYSEFGSTSGQQCGGATTTTNKCWTSSKGEVFRYGCKADDAEHRIYSTECPNGCDDCDVADWTWGGEKSQMCYNDGSNFYQFFCLSDPEPEKPKPKVTSCAELGWALQPGDLAVCGSSKVDNGACPKSTKSHAAAEAMCHEAGGRLCTVTQFSTFAPH